MPEKSAVSAPSVARAEAFARGDRVVLYERDPDGGPGRRHLVVLDGETLKVAELGIVNTANLEGLAPGVEYPLGSKRLLAWRANALDIVETVRRKAQIILPKDAAHLVFQTGIGPGSRVLEAGIGSGALTLALAQAVGASGRVESYEVRDDFQRWARGNLERAGLVERVNFHLADPGAGIAERDLDATIFDLPEPWLMVAPARAALRPGGTFAAYTPSVQQMESTVRALREAGYLDIHAEEVLVRPWHVGEKGVRPEFTMLAHTAWLTFARSPGARVAVASAPRADA